MRKDVFIVTGVGILVFFILLIGFLGSGWCTRADADTTMGFEKLGRGYSNFVWIMYDVETGVMYSMTKGTYNSGSMTLMVNPDGTPRVYEGFAR